MSLGRPYNKTGMAHPVCYRKLNIRLRLNHFSWETELSDMIFVQLKTDWSQDQGPHTWAVILAQARLPVQY